jgi:hypothetical protein
MIRTHLRVLSTASAALVAAGHFYQGRFCGPAAIGVTTAADSLTIRGGP